MNKDQWIHPPFLKWHYDVWESLPGSYLYSELDSYYKAATRPVNPNSISIQRMEKFTQACIVARLKGEHL